MGNNPLESKQKKFQPIPFLKSLVFYFILITGAVIMIVPFLWMLSTSLKTRGATMVMPPKLIPEQLTFENYIQITEAFPVLQFLGNSIIVAVLTTIGQVVLCSMAAYAFARLEFKGRDLLFLLYLGTMMVPMQVTMTPQFILMSYFGWLDSYQGLVMPGVFSAFGTFLLRQFLLTIPKSIEEAAFIEGASHWRVYWQIMLPMSKPALATLTVFAFMQSWNNYLWPLIMVSQEKMMTLPLGLATLQGRWETNWNLMMAGVVISVIPILAVYLFAQKYFIKGMTLSGLKE
jgi:multiple sugar transport system permease protein